MQRRKNEQGAVPARSERLFTQERYWYFKTHEGMDIGPFDARSDALEGVNSFIDYVGQAEPATLSRISAYLSVA